MTPTPQQEQEIERAWNARPQDSWTTPISGFEHFRAGALSQLARVEALEKRWYEATLGKDAAAILDEWIGKGAGYTDPSLAQLQGILQIRVEAFKARIVALEAQVVALEKENVRLKNQVHIPEEQDLWGHI